MNHVCAIGEVDDGTLRVCCSIHRYVLCEHHYARTHFVETVGAWAPEFACDAQEPPASVTHIDGAETPASCTAPLRPGARADPNDGEDVMGEQNTEYVPLGPTGRANVQKVIDELERVGEAIGGWTGKVDARQTGVSYYAKFEARVDVMTAADFANQMEQAPALLADACRRLLRADAHISGSESA